MGAIPFCVKPAIPAIHHPDYWVLAMCLAIKSAVPVSLVSKALTVEGFLLCEQPNSRNNVSGGFLVSIFVLLATQVHHHSL
jgi:hypothetical protein